MFESVENYVSELGSSVEYTQSFVKKIRGGVTRFANSIAKAEADVKEVKNETRYVATLKESIKKDAISNAKALLHGEILQAIRTNFEFDAPPYRMGLFEAVQNNDTYLIRSTGAGFKSIIRVDIDLNRTAGRLNFWAAGVKAYRKVLEQQKEAERKKKTKKGKEKPKKPYDPMAASRAWAGIFARREGTFSTFSTTIRNRIELSGRIAPYWQLLDKGKLQMRSDRGGYPTPANGPTNFVQNTEDAINEYISNVLSKEKDKYQELMSNYQVALDNARLVLDELANLVGQIALDSKKIGTLDREAERLLRANYITNLEKAVQLIREGLTITKGIQLATKGSYRGKRFDINTIKDLLNP